MSPDEASRERAALPSLPPRRRTGANLIRSHRDSEGPAAQVSAPDTEEAVARAEAPAQLDVRGAGQPAQAAEVSTPSGPELASARQSAPEGLERRVQVASALTAPTRVAQPSEGSSAGEGQAALSRWDQLNRRIFSVADPQVEELVELRKALMRLPARQRVLARDRERITESTLVRIGIDLVLRHRDQIEGVTENELRASLGLEPLRLRVEDSGSTSGPQR